MGEGLAQQVRIAKLILDTFFERMHGTSSLGQVTRLLLEHSDRGHQVDGALQPRGIAVDVRNDAEFHARVSQNCGGG